MIELIVDIAGVAGLILLGLSFTIIASDLLRAMWNADGRE